MSNSGASVNSADISQRFALDTQGFDAMKQAANGSAAGTKAVAKQFDAMFLQMMLKSMRDATPSNGLLDSNGGKMYTSMLDQQLAQQLSSKGMGLADQLLGQLTRNAATAAGQGGASSTSTGGLSSSAPGSGAGTGALGGHALSMKRLDAAGAVRSAGKSAHARAFVDKLSSAAESAGQATGIPARMLLGQAALESGWGRREIKRADGSTSYNVMGIKAGKNWTGPTVETATTEYHNGVAQTVTAKFRAYGSYQEAMTDYANVLKSNPRYAPVVAAAHDAAGFAQGLQKAGYATDPHYASKLLSVIKQMV